MINGFVPIFIHIHNYIFNVDFIFMPEVYQPKSHFVLVLTHTGNLLCFITAFTRQQESIWPMLGQCPHEYCENIGHPDINPALTHAGPSYIDKKYMRIR